MSRRKSDAEYEKTWAYHFFSWFRGEKDPYLGKVEMKPGEEADPKTVAEVRKKYKIMESEIEQQSYEFHSNRAMKRFRKIYEIASVVFFFMLAAILLIMVANLPITGTQERPVNNEVAQTYIESGVEDTGAVNFVAGMILTYRAFDTFGETCVLFIATTCVMLLLMQEEKSIRQNKQLNDRVFEPKNDIILQKVAFVLVPIIFLFGIYVILNGHISPGGGFSGGAIIGAGMILYVIAYGFDKMQKFFNENTYKIVKVLALSTYFLVVGYYILMGANNLENHISLGVPGMIFSAGIILWLNICVGIEVACTMYAFYALFRRGGL